MHRTASDPPNYLQTPAPERDASDQRAPEPPPPAPVAASKSDKETPAPAKKRKRRGLLRAIVVFLILVGVVACAARMAAPHAIRWYVNRTLDRSELYQGKIGDIDVHLYRGAYAINDVRLLKRTGNVPVPLFAAKRVEFAVEWRALWDRKIVGQFVAVEPELNFVDGQSDADSQTGAGGPWLQIIRDLFPFKINSARVRNGSIHFRTYKKETPVDVYLSSLDASVDNLTNIRDETTPLLTTVKATALAMDHAKFEYNMKLNPFTYRPTFHLTARLLGLDVTKINDLALAYGKFDFKRGYFDLVIETDARHGAFTGYVKPLFRDLKVFSLEQDFREDDPLQFFWTALVGLTTEIFKNQPRDQFGTLIPFSGTVDSPSPDILATVGNVLQNAFIRAYLPRLQGGKRAMSEGLTFEPPNVSDPVTVGDESP